mgnify:CR=1 FL=1
MQIQEIMTRSVDVISPNTTIRDAARRMRADNVGALPVGENDRLIGMVTDRDIVMRAVAEDRAAGATAVRDVMSERVFYCYADEALERAATVMAEHQVRRLPVLNRDKRLVGIVSTADLGRHVDEAGTAVEHAMAGISQPTDQPRR